MDLMLLKDRAKQYVILHSACKLVWLELRGPEICNKRKRRNSFVSLHLLSYSYRLLKLCYCYTYKKGMSYLKRRKLKALLSI